jgi:outer membrane biosynthesis protein TonB
VDRSVIGTRGVTKRAAMFIGAIGLFFGAAEVIGQTNRSGSTSVASSQYAKENTPQSGARTEAPSAEILLDTQGVDFAPYLRQTLQMIAKLWLPSLEEVNTANHGQSETKIRFTIGRDGRVSAMELVQSAHVIEVDRAAWGSIVGVGRLPSLPGDFKGPKLVIRMVFRVNPAQQ